MHNPALKRTAAPPLNFTFGGREDSGGVCLLSGQRSDRLASTVSVYVGTGGLVGRVAELGSLGVATRYPKL